MSYIENSLITGEQVLYNAKPALLPYMACPVTGIALGGLLIAGNVAGLGWFFIAAAALFAFIGYIRYGSVEFALTNRRVLAKRGIISKHSLDMQLRQIEGIQIKGMMQGSYGTVIIRGTGGTLQMFPSISKPLELRKAVQQQMAVIDAQNQQHP